MGSTAVGLNLVVKFVYVECCSQQEELCLHLYLASQEKTTKTHVLFQHAKGPLNLNGAINPQKNTFVSIDALLHLLALSVKVLGDVKVLVSFFQQYLACTLDAPALMRAAVTAGTGIYCGHQGIPCL